MKILKHCRWLILAVMIGALLRFWQLGNIPPSLDWDEAALGYNAYSILKTGRDEYGVFLPRVLRSYDDYKPPLYAYLTIPSVAVFGLTPWSVRLPSAIMGLLAIVGIYFLASALVAQTKSGKEGKWKGVPAVAALLLAISPWHIQFSRIAFEANIGVTLNIWAVISFLYGLRSRRWLGFSALFFGLALYAYHSERIFVPLLALLLAIFFRKELLAQKKNVVVAIIIGLLTVAPLVPVVLNQKSLTRLQGTSSLADQTLLLAQNVKKLSYDRTHGIFWGMVFDNRRLVWLQTLTAGYLSHYSFRWLYLTGDNARHHAPDVSLLYLWELPFLLWGMFQVTKRGGRMAKILWGWFIIAPIAASPTTELPHAIRTLVFLPSFQLFTAVGIIEGITKIKFKISNQPIKYKSYVTFFIMLLYVLFFIFNISYYFHMYFGHTNNEFSENWQYGYQEAVQYVSDNNNKYQKIIVSTNLEQPHMFFLFYLHYDPRKYLAEGGTRSGGFAEEQNKFGKYEFRPIRWGSETRDRSILYVGTPGEIPAPGLLTIRYLDGKDAIRIADR